MKLNLWQWLGILVIVLTGGVLVWRNTGQTANPPAATTQPAGDAR